jgi:osmotically-inducible protein OsmY
MRRLGKGVLLGAALAWFFDPRNGARRRNMTKDRVLAFFRRGQRRAERAGHGVAAEAYGLKQKLTHLHEEPKEFDDVTLAHKVESEIFRDQSVPKGQINVNAENGRVYLRGEVPTAAMIDDLVEKTRQVQGVREVENLLHPATASAPTSE